jgi:hypothetical protein
MRISAFRRRKMSGNVTVKMKVWLYLSTTPLDDVEVKLHAF